MKIEELRALTSDEALLWPEPGTGFIYAIVAPSGKTYVGQTIKSIAWRFKVHCDPKRSGCLAVWRAIWKYGPQNMRLYMLYAAPASELNGLERQAIVDCGSLSPKGYNLTTGGGVCVFTPETIEKMRASSGWHNGGSYGAEVNTTLGPDTLCNVGKGKGHRRTGLAAGWKYSPEQVRGLKEAFKVRGIKRLIRLERLTRRYCEYGPISEETLTKLHDALKHRVPLSKETKRKVSEALKGRKKSAETRCKMSEAARIRWLSDEERDKQSKALKGRTVSTETRARMSAARLGMKYKKRTTSVADSGTQNSLV